jgi:hypothetical protein
VRLLTQDELRKMDQNEVKQLFLSLRRKIKDAESSNRKSKKDKESLVVMQTYYCYVYRELEHRRVLNVQ